MLTQRSRLPQRQRRTFGAPGVRRLGRDFNLNLALSGHASRAPQCSLMAQSGHSTTEFRCPLLGVKQTLVKLSEMSVTRSRLNAVFTMLATLIYGRLTEMEQTKNNLSLS